MSLATVGQGGEGDNVIVRVLNRSNHHTGKHPTNSRSVMLQISKSHGITLLWNMGLTRGKKGEKSTSFSSTGFCGVCLFLTFYWRGVLMLNPKTILMQWNTSQLKAHRLRSEHRKVTEQGSSSIHFFSRGNGVSTWQWKEKGLPWLLWSSK